MYGQLFSGVMLACELKCSSTVSFVLGTLRWTLRREYVHPYLLFALLPHPRTMEISQQALYTTFIYIYIHALMYISINIVYRQSDFRFVMFVYRPFNPSSFPCLGAITPLRVFLATHACVCNPITC